MNLQNPLSFLRDMFKITPPLTPVERRMRSLHAIPEEFITADLRLWYLSRCKMGDDVYAYDNIGTTGTEWYVFDLDTRISLVRSDLQLWSILYVTNDGTTWRAMVRNAQTKESRVLTTIVDEHTLQQRGEYRPFAMRVIDQRVANLNMHPTSESWETRHYEEG